MTRKLSGLKCALSTKRAPLASLAIIGALAGALALIGCGSTKPPPGPTPVADAGDGGTGLSEAGPTACATPTFLPVAGTVPAGTMVTVAVAGLPANGFIYYTTDSTMPTHASTFVASGGTITVSQTETITAIAYAMGACSDSAVATATYTVGIDAGPVETACAPPTFNPPAGDIAVGSTVAIVSPAGFPATGEIFYTLDGTIPTHTSTAYSGPIQINGTTTEVIHAIAFAPTVCTDSTTAVATYTIEQPDGGTPPPAFNPPSTTQNNDFLVSLTDKASTATICFTYGAGSTPTCTVSATGATCTGTSQTYNAGAALGATGSVSITSGVTSAAGTVVVNAIACEAGEGTTPVVSQTYTLQAAAPTMQGPAPSLTLPYLNAAGTAAAVYTPGISSVTAGSSLRYTTDGSTATCATAMLLTGNPALIPVTVDSTFNAVACKTGYAPSTAAAFTYDIVLPTPTFVDSAGLHAAEGTGTYDADRPSASRQRGLRAASASRPTAARPPAAPPRACALMEPLAPRSPSRQPGPSLRRSPARRRT